MHQVQIGRIKREVPAGWNELTRRQLLDCVRVLYLVADPGQQRLHLAKALLQVSWGLLLSLGPEQLLPLLRLTDFLTESNNLTAQLLPHLRVWAGMRLRRLHGPRERFRNMSGLEFIFADTHFLQWLGHSDEKSLNCFLACLYRPRREGYDPQSPAFAGDIREDFNQHLVEDRAKVLACLPLYVKMAIVTWYRASRSQLEREYDLVFSSDNQQQASQSGWGKVILHLSGTKFGPLRDTTGVNIRTLLDEMQARAEEAEEIRRNTQRQP